MLYLLSDALNLICAHRAQEARLKLMEDRAREALGKAYEEARYPRQIEGRLVTTEVAK